MATVPSILQDMDYGKIEESGDIAKNWLRQRSTFGSAIQGGLIQPPTETEFTTVNDLCTGKPIAIVYHASDTEVENAISAATKASASWLQIKIGRSRYLKRFVDHVEASSDLLAQVESISRGVQLKDPREFDVPALLQCFRYYAGWTTSMIEFDDWQPWGVVAAAASVNSPLVALAWMIAPALAAGNCVVLVVPSQAALPALLLGKLWIEAGLPHGVLSVLPGTAHTINKVFTHKDVMKTSCYGPTAFVRDIREKMADLPLKRLTTIMTGKTPMLVFETADVDSAVENAIKWAWYNQGAVPWAVQTVYVQEPVLQAFTNILRHRLANVRVGSAFDKMADMGLPYDKQIVQKVAKIVTESGRNGTDVIQVKLPEGLSQNDFFPPTVLVGGEAMSNQVIDDEECLPVLTLVSFRVPKEAVALANRSRYGFAASVWTENGALALEVAEKLKVGTVWINSHGIFNASVPIEGWKESGIGAFGGKAGLLDNLHLIATAFRKAIPKALTAKVVNPAVPPVKSTDDEVSIEKSVPKTYQLYYGGAYKNADGNATRPVQRDSKLLATVADASRKDVRNAVDAAIQAQSKWESAEAVVRENVMYKMTEAFNANKDHFSSSWNKLYELCPSHTKKMWSKVADCMKFWTSACSRGHYSQVEPNINNMMVTVSRRALGVIALGFLDDQTHNGMLLTNLVWQVMAAVCFGNAAIVVIDSENPTPYLDLLKAIVAGVPAGVVNVLTGNVGTLMGTLAEHQCVDAVFLYGCPQSVEAAVVKKSAQSMKHISNSACDFIVSKPCCANRLLSQHLMTRSKGIWFNRGTAFA